MNCSIANCDETAVNRGYCSAHYRRHRLGQDMNTPPLNNDLPAGMQAADKPKQMNPKHLRRTLYWLALDWINLTTTLPTPPKREQMRRSNTREYGHPAEWASDTAADIADKFTSWHDYLAEERGEKRPIIGAIVGGRTFRSRVEKNQDERRRVVAAWKYLEPRCEQLVQMVDYEDLRELPELHHRVRSTLGHFMPKYTLPIPCPNEECGLRTLVRVQGVGQDFISCDSCGYTIKEVHYPLLVRMTLDAFLSVAA